MPVVSVEGLSKTFLRSDGSRVHAVRDVSFSLEEGETMALIGESGSGKSTVGRLLLGLMEADSGDISVLGEQIRHLPPARLRKLRSRFSMVFQEPFESLNPRMKIGSIISEPLSIHEPKLDRDARRKRLRQTLAEVGLSEEQVERYPADLSGGQQQRVGIARALIVRPGFLVLDEPTSSLDLSVQAQILELLRDLQVRYRLTYLYISHDISTVRHIAHRAAVLYRGEIREIGPVEEITERPRDPYTVALLDAYLSADPREKASNSFVLHGELGGRPPEGCMLTPRCPIKTSECLSSRPVLRRVDTEHAVRCIHPKQKNNDTSTGTS